MSDVDRQRAAIADQQAEYAALQERRYPAAEPLFITCMCGSFASILSATTTLVAEVNTFSPATRSRVSESDPTAPRRTPA
jgi:hypothetical protein